MAVYCTEKHPLPRNGSNAIILGKTGGVLFREYPPFLNYYIINSEQVLSCNCNVMLILIILKNYCNVTVMQLIPRAPVIVSHRFKDYVGLGIT